MSATFPEHNAAPAEKLKSRQDKAAAPHAAVNRVRFDFESLTLQDARRLRKLLSHLKNLSEKGRVQGAGAPKEDASKQAERQAALYREAVAFYEEARARYDLRKASLPKLTYPENLPVSARHDEIVSAILNHQVVIIAGETGSGKTTQIPKMCLEAGLGVRGLIGHTQPRRIAARAVSARIAKELNQNVGEAVGYKVRFSDQSSESSYIKLMTDGILLAETASDRLLLSYDCIIIDEAHERSLNIDFLIGYLKNLLPKRPDLKVIITSATIDVERFSEHFNGAPIIEVSGRTYPVEVVYMPLDGSDRHGDEDEDSAEDDTKERAESDVQHGVLKAFRFLQKRGPGDTLVFLPGERDIMDMAAFLNRAGLRNVEILPLYARLEASAQNRIFEEHAGVRIVLATNVAETSLTVPFIKYVIDPGLARISRYSARTKVQRLPVEPISQASANQRKGRCGRVAEGVCVRLYSESDFLQRPEFTDPEILRTSLASVILQMISLRLGDIRVFPFIDPPEERQITDGLRLLEELGAISEGRGKLTSEVTLTETGRALASLKADPRLSRMLVEAYRTGALSELLIIASALAVMDPRERPLDRKEAATQAHARFNDEKSDFLAFLNLYNYISTLQKELSNAALRRRLKKEFISYLRVREWLDVLRQLRASCQQLGYTLNTEPASYETIHRAILSGLLSQIGTLDVNEKGYTGARGVKFVVHPSSVLAKKRVKWLCAHELSETSRLFARTVAEIDPLWAESLGRHLTRKNYHDMAWSKSRGEVTALLNITLYGLQIVKDRRASYTSVDPKLCRELLIRDGLVTGDIIGNFPFLKRNLALIDEVSYLEDKVRRRDILVDESALEAFYDSRLPQDITTARALAHFWKGVKDKDPQCLDFTLADVVREGKSLDVAAAYPETWSVGTLKLKLSYTFTPGEALDGIAVHVPVTVINQIDSDVFTWQIPGLREELLATLIRSLPKRLRRNLIPAPNYAHALSEALVPYEGNLFEKAAKELTRMGGEIVTVEDFDKTQIPAYLSMNFIIENLEGKEIATGKNFKVLCEELQGTAREALQQVVKSDHRARKVSTAWSFGTLKKEQNTRQGSLDILAYPALTVKEGGVCVELYDSPERQRRAMREGTVRLLMLSIKSPTAYLESHLPNRAKLSMYYAPLGTVKELIDDLVKAAILRILDSEGGPAWDKEGFDHLAYKVRENLNDTALGVAREIEPILLRAHELRRLLKGKISFEVAWSYSEMGKWLDSLVYKGFVSATPAEHLREIPRYLQAGIDRLSRMLRDVNRDKLYATKLEELSDRIYGLMTRYPKDLIPEPLFEVRWMVEELRVSYFAQPLGVKGQVSEKRVSAELDRIVREFPPLH